MNQRQLFERASETSRETLRASHRRSIALSNVIISVMITMMAFSLIYLLREIAGMQITNLMLPFVFFTTLEVLYGKEIERRLLAERMGGAGNFHLAEILLISILLRLLLFVGGAPDSRFSAFFARLDEPFSAFFVPEYQAGLFIVLGLWLFCFLLLGDLRLIYNLEENVSWEQIGKDQRNLILIRQRFLMRLLFMGVLILMLMTISESDWSGGETLRLFYHGSSPTLVAVVMGYFFLALLLMSQTQFARLRTRWWLNGSQISPLLTKRWVRVSLLFFAVLGLVVMLVPTGFSDVLLTFLRDAFVWMVMAVSYLWVMLIYLFSRLFPPQEGALEETLAEPTPPPFIPPDDPSAPARTLPVWMETAKDALFWVVLALVIGFAVYQYMRQDRDLLRDLQTMLRKVRSFLRDFFCALWTQFKIVGGSLSDRARKRIASTQQARSVNGVSADEEDAVRELDHPRLQVMALYAAFLRLGVRLGSARKTHQTPLQYERQMEAVVLDEAVEPVHELTDAFDRARYSAAKIPTAEAEQLKKDWHSLAKKLREGKNVQDG
ncbi:MAG: DUF4129 domain-containing protein [Anaerolineaceae bacterium]|nr:DUF4129 domain-containing protein [Anaerolineaceae bacterium]